MNKREEQLKFALEMRGVRDPCPKCSGLGIAWYSNTSTWRGGVGGSVVTRDTCDVCWGSGDKYRPWTDLCKQEREMKQEIERRALTMFVDRIGASMDIMAPTIAALCAELDKMSRGRKPRPHFYYETCEQLAEMLRSSMNSTAENREAKR